MKSVDRAENQASRRDWSTSLVTKGVSSTSSDPMALGLIPGRKTKDRTEVRPPLVERGMRSLHDRGGSKQDGVMVGQQAATRKPAGPLQVADGLGEYV